MTRPRRPVGALAVAICLTIATAGALVLRGRGDVLAPEPYALVHEVGKALIGTSYEYGLDGFTNSSQHRVRFIDVRPVSLSPGIVVDDVRAINNCPYPRMTVIGGKVGRIEQTNPELPLHPISSATIDPHSQSCWYFLVTVHPTQLGFQAINGFELVYRVNGRTERHRVPLGIELTVIGSGIDPDSDVPVPLYQ